MSRPEQRPAFNAVYVSREGSTGVSEGLNVLFADLVRSLLALEHPVRIFTTKRHVKGLEAVLQANDVDVSRVAIRTILRGGWLLRVGWPGGRREKRGGRLLRWLRTLRQWFAPRQVARFLAWFFDVPWFLLPFTLAALALVMGAAGIVGMVALVLAIPGIFLAAAAFVALRLSRRLAPVVYRKLHPDGKRPPKPSLRSLVGSLAPQFLEELYRQESRHFGTALARVKDADRFFFCNAFEGYVLEAIGNAKKKIVVFPDAVGAVFPTRYPVNWYGNNVLRSAVASMRAADGIVCYSQYVRDFQLKKFLGPQVSDKKIEVIPQGFFIDRGTSEAGTIGELNKYVKGVLAPRSAFGEVQFGHFDYVLYPTVDRPHKNTLTLLRAVEALLRRRQANIKLVITSHGVSPDVADYIGENHLHREVLFMPSLPVEVLNKLITGALAVVHPSLAEGGDIFNFSRAASHDCPALLSDIPVAREMFERYGIGRETYRDWMFNPFNYLELAEKIGALQGRRAEVAAAQKAVLDRLSAYRFENMAQRYFDFVQSA